MSLLAPALDMYAGYFRPDQPADRTPWRPVQAATDE